MKVSEHLITTQVHAALSKAAKTRRKLLKSDRNQNFKNQCRHKRFIHPKTKN